MSETERSQAESLFRSINLGKTDAPKKGTPEYESAIKCIIKGMNSKPVYSD